MFLLTSNYEDSIDYPKYRVSLLLLVDVFTHPSNTGLYLPYKDYPVGNVRFTRETRNTLRIYLGI